MAQILRPVATTLSTRIASGDHTSIDEITPDDGDYIQSLSVTNSQSSIYECRLSPPPDGIPGPGVGTLRLRRFGQDSGSQARQRLYQGTTELGANSIDYPSVGIQTAEMEFDISGVTDWSDVRIRLLMGPRINANNGWYRAYWLEFEVPDPIPNAAWFEFF